jgi:hypothetical protein
MGGHVGAGDPSLRAYVIRRTPRSHARGCVFLRLLARYVLRVSRAALPAITVVLAFTACVAREAHVGEDACVDESVDEGVNESVIANVNEEERAQQNPEERAEESAGMRANMDELDAALRMDTCTPTLAALAGALDDAWR